MTAEDEKPYGKLRARLNVIHEAGLFQGRLGFNKAIVLLEDGCEEFSNIMTQRSQGKVTMSTEREWVDILRTDVEKMMKGQNVDVRTGVNLPYQILVASYAGESAKTKHPSMNTHGYQTDLLISEPINNSEGWVPRVVVEFKLRQVTTHDALTYSAKAATHKNLHPYLRYGIIIGGHPSAVPRRLVRHGHQFDFMMTLASEELTPGERKRVCALLLDELRASREMSLLLSGSKSSTKLVHRKWVSN
jgi:Predicted nucleotide-binding protein containing TIR-like domain